MRMDSPTEHDTKAMLGRWATLMHRLLTPVNGLILLTCAIVALTMWSYHYFGKYSPFADIINRSSRSGFDQIGLQVDNAVISVRGGGHKRFRVAAREITFSRDHRSITVDGLQNGVLYNNIERPAVKFNGGHVVYQTPTGSLSASENTNLTLTGGVTAWTVAPGGPRITTDNLAWDARRNIVHAPGSVTIVFPRNAASAVAKDVRFDARTHDLTLGSVHGTFRVAKLVQ